MKEQLYIVKSRYQYYGSNGVDWTSWFVLNSEYRNKQGTEDYIKEIKHLYNDIDKRTHLKHDYMIVPVEDFENEIKELDKTINKANKRDEKYFASDEWKELKHKKYVARKERKLKQEEYLKMQEELKNQ